MAAKWYFLLLLVSTYIATAAGGLFYKMHYCQAPSVCTDINKCFQFANLGFPSKSLISRNLCGMINNTPQICCLLLPSTTIPSIRVSRLSDDLVNHKNFELLPMDVCGAISNNFRITSGTSTSPGEFPWMALIAYKTGKSQDFKCGGTLINERYVLTAAHCINNATIFGIRLGESNILTETDCDTNGQNCEPSVQDLLINQTITHPFYDPSNYINDIALIKLATPANYSYENVRPICLPFDELLHVNLDGQELIVAGWGATENGGKSMVLRKVSVPVLPTADCQKLYENIKPISKKQICAGGGRGRDSCAGDSGGPLKRVDFINRSPRYVQYGIVSFGPTRCGISMRPGIYTNVREYMTWILDNIEP